MESVRAAIEDARTPVLVSAVCVWEAAIKSALGKLRVPDDLPERLDEFEFERLPITDVHAWAVRALPPIHNDPLTGCSRRRRSASAPPSCPLTRSSTGIRSRAFGDGGARRFPSDDARENLGG